MRKALRLSAAIAAVCILTALTQAQQPHQATNHERVLYTFGKTSVGFIPNALIRDAKGNLFGSNGGGGNTTGNCSPPWTGCGTVFELTAAGKMVVLHTFNLYPDGAEPTSLVEDARGNLYGATAAGGNGDCEFGCGTLFKVTPAGKFTLLHTFGPDGLAVPTSGLTMDTQGNLYGAVDYGTNALDGAIYEWTTSGKLKVLYRFSKQSDGAYPNAVVPDNEGNLYGTTANGGDLSCAQDYGNGCGLVYKLDISKGIETVLYTFKGGADGAIPAFASPLVRDKAGNLYGTTMAGGNNQDCITSTTTGCGTLFKIDAPGAFSVLFAFNGTDGNIPIGLMKGPKGNFYGATYTGGNGCTDAGGCGTVFKFSAGRKESVLYNFRGQSDGGLPAVGVVEDGNHNLYGTTEQGGDLNCTVYGQGCGVIFEITAN
ncbi:MAG TPA: choice-of-anchor tandem repeat GloVer-containing protein [Terriglobales bacterium]|jgi:uncharacterized repeat protein (TIGR03803 family)|nr:choice-of-anchor tandem repeat GloVer-containing protein [Terriglobales bacterium]